MTRPGIEPWSPGPLANTLPTKPMIQRFNQADMLYKENEKKNTYKWMRKDLLISYTNAFRHGLFKIWNNENFK